MNKKIILITGGTGFIASNFIEELIDKNYSIIATTRKKNLKSSNKNLKYISCSFEKINTRILKKCDYLIHLASTDTGNFDKEFVNSYETNVINSLKLIEMSIENGIKKILVCGSCFEYGLTGNKKAKLDIYDNLMPIGYYAITKASLYLQLKHFTKSSKTFFNLTYARIFQAYGFNERKKRLIPSIIHAAKNNKNITIQNSNIKRDFIDVRDVVNQCLNKLFKNKKKFNIENIGNGKGITVKEFSKKIWRTYSKNSYKIKFNNSKNYKLKNLVAKK